MSNEKLTQARTLIRQKRYKEARTLLQTIDDPTAQVWLEKLNQLYPAPASATPPPSTAKTTQSSKRPLILGLTIIGAIVIIAIVAAFVLLGGEDDSEAAANSGLPQSLNVALDGGGTLTLHYPESWVASSFLTQTYLANTSSALNKLQSGDTDQLSSGEVYMLVIAASYDDSEGSDFSPSQMVSDVFGRVADEATAGDIQELTIQGQPAARLDYRMNTDNTQGMLLGIQIPDAHIGVVLVAGALQGELDAVQPTILDIADNLTWTAQP